MALWRITMLAGSLILTSCSSDYQGKPCQGKIESLQGQPLGETEALVLDRFTSFTVTLPDSKIDSGPLHTTDRALYLPSAVTREGFLAQRLSDNQFCLINSPKNQMVTYTCK